MKRLVFISLLISAPVIARVTYNAQEQAEDSIKKHFVKVYINKIQNALSEDCSLVGLGAISADESVRPTTPLLVPFVSLDKYLKAYTSFKAYVPDAALKIDTPYGRYRLWASESGVMYAQDPKDTGLSIDTWKAKKILGITRDEHGGKELYQATLVLKAINNKLKMALDAAAR